MLHLQVSFLLGNLDSIHCYHMTLKSEHGMLSVKENGAECQNIQVSNITWVWGHIKKYVPIYQL